MILVMGVTGSGKSYVANLLKNKISELGLTVSYLPFTTTRPKREKDSSDSNYSFINPMTEEEWKNYNGIMKRSYKVANGDTWRYCHVPTEINSDVIISAQIESIYALNLLINQYPDYEYLMVWINTSYEAIITRANERSSSEDDIIELKRRMREDYRKFMSIDWYGVDESSNILMPNVSDLTLESEWNLEKKSFIYDNELDWKDYKNKYFYFSKLSNLVDSGDLLNEGIDRCVNFIKIMSEVEK